MIRKLMLIVVGLAFAVNLALFGMPNKASAQVMLASGQSNVDSHTVNPNKPDKGDEGPG